MTIIKVDTAKIGRKGGHARAANLSAEERSSSASGAAKARWDAYYKAHPDKLKAKKERGAKKAAGKKAVK
jgi:hypothetical protein